ncbi:MAG: hypothetical protein OEZ23_03980, partial [Gammaproteobacteria bacterium]|nr:hypothetical protein [Gammaproteobacteria bacterium]
TFTSTATFTITKNGVAYVDGADLPTLEQKRFYAARYNTVTEQYEGDRSATRYASIAPTATAGQYTATAAAIPFAPELSDAHVYGYIADGALHTEQPGGSHVHLYDDVASAALAFGAAAATDPSAYVSAANVSGCEKCHGSPYMKHGYRAPEVAGLPDFASCKVCHFDDRDGGHEDWQILADNPVRYAEIHEGSAITPEEEIQYAYKAKLMNDVHMAHAMEFPYPQSMANCVTCHEGKLTQVLSDANYTAETCKSCHPVTGPAEGTESGKPPAMKALWAATGLTGHNMGLDCGGCHYAGNGLGAPIFTELHSGYNAEIYAVADGTRYADIFTASVDSASFSDNVLTFSFSVSEAASNPTALTATDIIPTVMVGLYGYNTKHFIVGPHNRDAERNRLLELKVDGVSTNPRVAVVSAGGGVWEMTADLSMWTDMITDGVIKRAEIGFMPELRDATDTVVALNAPSRTFDLTANAFDDTYFPDVVDVEGCNNCHEALATTFHTAMRGGNIKICKMCHVPSSRGSHLELASRSIDNYVHAIHSFQAFDPGNIDFNDPVQAVKYELHTNHVFPNFTAMNCESCHNPGTYEVPDQSKSLPSLHAGTDTFAGERNIGAMGQFVTGPASRACGSCHRAPFLNKDDAGGLIAFNQHTKENGYMVDDGEGVWDVVVETILSLFE